MEDDPSRKLHATYARLIALRGLVLALMAGVASLGLYVTSAGQQLRVFERAFARGPIVNPRHCPTVERTVYTPIHDRELDEVSGMAASRKQQGLFWLHNDSGDTARVFAVDSRGELRAEVTLANVEAHDFEDIAVISTPAGEPDILVVADTGNNFKRRDVVQLLLLPEPAIPRDVPALRLAREVRSVEVRYEDGARDVESIFVDPQGDVYLVTKTRLLLHDELAGLYRVTADALRSGKATARHVASVPIDVATAADMSADGRTLAMRNYWYAVWWSIAPGQSVADAVKTEPCHYWLKESSRQGEALTFLPDGSGFVTAAEGDDEPILRFRYGPPEAEPKRYERKK